MIDLRRILVPTDFSKSSDNALTYAVAFAEKFGAEVLLLHVVQDASLFVPEAFGSHIRPYKHITQTRDGSYWNLVVPYALASGFFEPGSRQARGLLRYLLEHQGRVFSREQLLDMVWGQDVYVEPRTVDVHIRRLRKAINAPNESDLIRTVRSAGYSLDRGE